MRFYSGCNVIAALGAGRVPAESAWVQHVQRQTRADGADRPSLAKERPGAVRSRRPSRQGDAQASSTSSEAHANAYRM